MLDLEEILKDYKQRKANMPSCSKKEDYLDKILDFLYQDKAYGKELIKTLHIIKRAGALDTAIQVGKLFSFYVNKECMTHIKKEVDNIISTRGFAVFNRKYENLSQEGVFKAISVYENGEYIDKIISLMFEKGEMENDSFAKNLLNKKVRTALNGFNHLFNLAVVYSASMDLDLAIKTIAVGKKYDKSDYSVNTLFQGAFRAGNGDFSKENYGLLLDVLDKYYDNNREKLSKVLLSYLVSDDPIDYYELLRDESYEKIKNVPSLIRKIIHSDYTSVRYWIKYEFDYPELDYARQTLDFVMDIHERRDKKDKTTIYTQFFVELHRAISQGTTHKSKVKYLRTYCREVQEQMKQNAGELMYET